MYNLNLMKVKLTVFFSKTLLQQKLYIIKIKLLTIYSKFGKTKTYI